MVIDGNDERGIDVGLVTREGFPIGAMRSHVDDRLRDGSPVFSRDCPEFNVATPGGNRIVVLVTISRARATDRPRSRTSDVERRRHVWPRSTRN